MSSSLPLAAFIYLLAQGADAAQFFSEFRAKVRKSPAISVRYTLVEEIRGNIGYTIKGSIKVGGTDRWSADLSYTGGATRKLPKRVDFSALFSGNVLTQMEVPRDLKIDASAVASDLRTDTMIGFLPHFYYLHPGNDQRHHRRSNPPAVDNVRDGGDSWIGDRRTRVVEYSVTFDFGWQTRYAAKALFDVKTGALVRRVFTSPGQTLTETFDEFLLGEKLPASEFAFQSKRRLARVLATQLARSVQLFGMYTGRHPRKLEDLVSRPPDLPIDVFWPQGGFFLASRIPKDSWGRPFALREERGRVSVACLGADGLVGGRGDDEDAVLQLPAVSGRGIGAPSGRLHRYFTARVRIQLLAGTVRAFRQAYARLPRKKASLWDRPGWAEIWPEKGWLEEGTIPPDPWGIPYRLIIEPREVIIQVRDPDDRVIAESDLTHEERVGLAAAARRRLGDEDLKVISGLFDDLRADSVDVRMAARESLSAWGPLLIEALDARLKVEKDIEAITHLKQVRQALGEDIPEWKHELDSLSVTVTMRPSGRLRQER